MKFSAALLLCVAFILSSACRSARDKPGAGTATETGSDAFFVGSSGHQIHPLPKDCQAQLDELREAVSRLENTIGHLKSELESQSAENELTAMTIDSVKWPEETGFSSGFHGEKTILCHPAEWHGYGKMLRFLRQTDRVFYFEAEGHPTLEGEMMVGGICNSDGSTRYTWLQLPHDLEPGVSYRIRPRNENEEYRWSVGEDVVVVAR